MTPRKPKSHPAHYPKHPVQNPTHHERTISQQAIQPSDYESDTLAHIPDLAPPPLRTNDDLNLAVLKRHNPSISRIVSLANYAVVYLYSQKSGVWDKVGIEGSLFVCQLSPTQNHLPSIERYSLVILNRRGLDNFTRELENGDDVEITSEYVIIRVGQQAYGLWIFDEPGTSTGGQRMLNANFIKECAIAAEDSRSYALQDLGDEVEATEQAKEDEAAEAEAAGAVAMGRQLSLRELFGQQRAADDAWSIKNHTPPQPEQIGTPLGQTAGLGMQTSASPFVPGPDTDFFRTSARPSQQQQPQISEQNDNDGSRTGQVDLLGSLFKKAAQRS
jgi:Dcp1-like decapping family